MTNFRRNKKHVKRNAIVDKTVAKKEKGMRGKARNRKQRTHCKLSFTILLELFKVILKIIKNFMIRDFHVAQKIK